MDTHRVPSTLSAPACDLQSERTPQEAAAEGGPPFKRICVFCGSSSGSRPEYVAAAVALGQRMVNEGIELVYGGGTVGLMGAIALTVRRFIALFFASHAPGQPCMHGHGTIAL